MPDKKQYRTIDEYIADLPKGTQSSLIKVRQTIRKVTPTATEKISYGIPTFDLNGKHLVHFAAYRSHVGFYPTPSAIVAFKKELASYKTAKGSIQFPIDKVPLELIKRIVEFRVKESSKG